MILAAEKVFSNVGFKNAKMDDIAAEAGITKVTLYSYFQSKENLYLAVTYNTIQQINDALYESVDRTKGLSGLESTLGIITTFMSFCERNFFSSEIYLDYFALMRSSSSGRNHLKLTDAIKESIYFMKLRDIQNIGFKISAKEIMRGQKDGSINPQGNAMVYTMVGWTTVLGYIKVLSASGQDGTPAFNVDIRDVREECIAMMRNQLTQHL